MIDIWSYLKKSIEITLLIICIKSYASLKLNPIFGEMLGTWIKLQHSTYYTRSFQVVLVQTHALHTVRSIFKWCFLYGKFSTVLYENFSIGVGSNPFTTYFSRSVQSNYIFIYIFILYFTYILGEKDDS